MTQPDIEAELAELDAIAVAMRERIRKLRERQAAAEQVVDREPPAEAYARVMARRRRRGVRG